jgi:4-diphosphocytidyl-2-C-methyl-D-erythritol kinase
MTALPLTALAPAKINLGLFVGPLRADGRHEIVTVMQSISLADSLTLRAAPAGSVRDEVHCPSVPGPAEENLAARALSAFRAAVSWDAPPLELSILKRVPVVAGLGGGSGDAAAALRLAAKASGLGEGALLDEIARTLGADVPAQVRPGRWLARGAGELLRALPDPGAGDLLPVPPDPGASLGVLVLPVARPLSTAAVYTEADRLGSPRGAAELEEIAGALAGALASGAPLPPTELLHNDLALAARKLCPEIDPALEEALSTGADAALLSGSGPTVLGLFAGPDGPARAAEAARALGARTPAPFAAEPVGAGFADAAPPAAAPSP